MEKIFDFLKTEMEVPVAGSAWHLFFVGLTIFETILFAILFRNSKEKTFRKVILIMWIIMCVMEVYKEVIYTFEDYHNPSYKWALFPFQFCSTPFYVFPILIFCKEGKFRDMFLGFTATFVLFAGIGLLSVPTSFCQYVGINIQTMVHHGIQVVVGILVAVHENKKFTFIYFLKSLLVLLAFITLAILMNEFIFTLVKEMAWGSEFNMFYISRHVVNQLPVLDKFWAKSYMLFILTYIIGFSAIGFVIFVIEKYIGTLVRFFKKK